MPCVLECGLPIAQEYFLDGKPTIGARPLKRAIQDDLLDPLATKFLAGEFKPNDKIKISAQDGELVFQKRG